MRKKILRTIVAFHTTTDALALEAACLEKGVPGRLIPLPTIISAGCGMCWSAPAEEKEPVLAAMQAAGIDAAGIYTMML